MSAPALVTVLLGAGVVPADTPVLRADDPGVMRGDGIFEAMHIRDGGAWLLDEHLARMAGSAARLELSLPPAAALRELVAQVLAASPAGVEGRLRLVCARGPDGDATVYATAFAVPESTRRARCDGVRVVTAPHGSVARPGPETPWLLGGAKSMSYAMNLASLRRARAAGADDVLWVSSDGFALEAPTSSLVWLEGRTLRTVPAAGTGILAGTTAAYLLEHAGQLGFDAGEGLETPDALTTTGGAWLTSSVRGVAAIRTLDGAPLPYDAGLTERIRTLLGYPAPIR